METLLFFVWGKFHEKFIVLALAIPGPIQPSPCKKVAKNIIIFIFYYHWFCSGPYAQRPLLGFFFFFFK